MYQSAAGRVLTTHTGSLPRPDDLVDLLYRNDAGQLHDPSLLQRSVRKAVEDLVQTQVQHRVDIVNDGEAGKVGYATYIKDRLTGFEGLSKPRPAPLEWQEFPEFYQRNRGSEPPLQTPACSAPITWKGDAPLQADIDILKQALKSAQHDSAFMTAVSPGAIWYILPNEYYPSDEA